MYRENNLKKHLASGGRAVGCWLQMVSPLAAEIIGGAGFDCVVIDHEHGPGSITDGIGQMQALSAYPTTCLMRVPWNDTVYIKRALDSGIEGIMIPCVNHAAEARAAVAACKYPPIGVRGAAMGAIRGANYGADAADYTRTVDDNVFVICQIETRKAVDNIAEIAAVEGVDMLFIGPTDLSADIGYIGRALEAEPQALIRRAEDAIKASGKYLSSIVIPGRTAEQMLEQGYHLVLAVSEVGLLRDAARAKVASCAPFTRKD